jgi:DUF4097 and DUF4098 domain-containing protein YvlB
MKYYLLTLGMVLMLSAAQAQVTDPAATARHAKKELKAERKKESEKRRKEEIAKKEEVQAIETKPRYGKTVLFRKKKTKNGLPVQKEPDNTLKRSAR